MGEGGGRRNTGHQEVSHTGVRKDKSGCHRSVEAGMSRTQPDHVTDRGLGRAGQGGPEQDKAHTEGSGT